MFLYCNFFLAVLFISTSASVSNDAIFHADILAISAFLCFVELWIDDCGKLNERIQFFINYQMVCGMKKSKKNIRNSHSFNLAMAREKKSSDANFPLPLNSNFSSWFFLLIRRAQYFTIHIISSLCWLKWRNIFLVRD